MRLLAFLLLACSASAQFLEYDSNRRVDYFNDVSLSRDEYHWFAKITESTSKLYQNGNYVSEESGTNDIRLLEARQMQTEAYNVKIGVVDTAANHGQRVKAVAELVSGVSCLLSSNITLHPADVSLAISNFVNEGCNIVVVTIPVGKDEGCSNACVWAESNNCLVFAAVPNVSYSIDQFSDYPASWSNVVGVTMTDRSGELLAGAAAWGSNVIAAPGRNIVVTIPPNWTNYSSGTSYATPMLAGCVALLIARHPNQTAAAYREAIVKGSIPIVNSRRIDAVALLEAPTSTLSIVGSVVTVNGLSKWEYSVEHSDDLVTWTGVTSLLGGQSFVASEGFYRSNSSK
jgi:subtilisin family serine protease